MSAAEWIAKRRELLAAATEGPWETDGSEITQHWSLPEPWKTVASSEVVCGSYCYGGAGRGIEHATDAALIADARTSLPTALDALEAVLEFATAERNKISRTYISQPDTAYAGYANAMDDVIRTIEAVLRGES